ncbi:MAG: cyclopropane-fatty-acyl-phospholipid synthase family protein [Rhizobiaceae bacterium]
MNALLRNHIVRLVEAGNLTITGADGRTETFGDGSGEPVHIVVKSRKAEWAIAIDPMLALPEAYMNGELDFAKGDVISLLRIVYESHAQGSDLSIWTVRLAEGVRYVFRRLQQLNTITRSRDNVRRHYDLSGDLYRLFLDEDMQYSCGYFKSPHISLDEAQRAKKHHIAAKLCMDHGRKVLDIGSGWGGLGLYLAENFDAEVLGVTLSEEQHAVSNRRAAEHGLDGRSAFELRDYRHLDGPFDRIVSVGMFEHVGVNHYRTFFQKCAELLDDDGVMLLHSIGRHSGPTATNAFIRKYIFPGGYIPALSEVMPAIEKSGLIATDIEILRLHYAETLKQWRERFMANREKAVEIYDERFARMWEFYLAGSEASFRWDDLMVFQIQLAHRRDAVPLTRDYIGETEKQLAAADRRPGRHFREAAE